MHQQPLGARRLKSTHPYRQREEVLGLPLLPLLPLRPSPARTLQILVGKKQEEVD